MAQWSKRHHRCILCLETDFKHVSYGLCNSCYQKVYKANPEINARIDKQKQEWYFRFHDANLSKRKADREQRHFDGMRDLALSRDGYACVRCGSSDQLTVHHKDGNGRGSDNPNNSLDNLETLCRGCHMMAHYPDLYAMRASNGFYRPKIGKYKSRKRG